MEKIEDSTVKTCGAESWLLQARMQLKRLTPQNMELESTLGESYFLIY